MPYTGTRGLKFNDEYEATVVETPNDDSDPLISDPPTPVTGVVATALCVDDEGNPVNDPLVYSIMDGYDTMSLFSIDSGTGDFSVADVPFDYEERQWYLVPIVCSLSSDPSRNVSGSVNVSIGPLNEYLPRFDDSDSLTTFSIRETTPSGKVLAATDHSLEPEATYTVSDRDKGPDGVIVFSLHASRNNADDRFFNLDTLTGTLTLNTQLDVDNTTNGFQKLEISITLCNSNVTIEICATNDLIVFVTSDNDLTPMFTEPLYTASINESESNGTVVLQAVCVDADRGVGGVESIAFSDETLQSTVDTFELHYIPGTKYAVDLSLVTELDYENTRDYTFQLVCSDGSHTDTAEVEIDVLPVNDNLPEFDQGQYKFSLDRSDPSPTDTIIGTVRATDADSVETGTVLVYSIVTSAYFNIDSETGEITLKDYLNAGDGDSFAFDVTASDGEHETTAHVRITANGLLSVPEWIYVGVGGAVLLIILVIVGIIVFYCFIRAAAIVKVVEKYKE